MRSWRPRAPVVLVLDDDPDILNVLGLVLESEGCVVRSALEPEQAAAQLDGVDVVLVDQRLRRGTGTEFIAAARVANPRARFLVISADQAAAAEAQRAADGYLSKPIEVRALLGEIERLFQVALRA